MIDFNKYSMAVVHKRTLSNIVNLTFEENAR